MANVKISDLAFVTLPIDTVNTLFEVQTVEAGIQVSRKITAQDLGIGGGVTSVSGSVNINVDNTDPQNPIVNFSPAASGAFNTLRVNAGGTAWEETGDLQIASTQVIVEGVNLRLRSGAQFLVNTDDNAAAAFSVNGPATTGGDTILSFTGNAAINAAASGQINLQTGGASHLSVDGTNSRLVFNDFPLFIEERAAAGGDVAGFGQLFVRNDTPNVLIFRDDAGTEFQLGAAAPGGANTSVQFNDSGSFNGFGTWDGSTLEIAESQARITLDETDGGGACSIFLTSTTTADSGLVIEFDSSTGTDARIRQATSGGTLQDIWISLAEDAGVGLRHNNIQKMITIANGVQMDDSIYIVEKVAAGGDVAGQGQLWVRNDTPNVLVFTDDAGTDTVLGAGGGGVNSVTGGSNITNSGTAADPVLDVDDPLIIASINATSALGVSSVGSPYDNVPLNIGANLTGTQGMTQYARQRIQARPSSFGFNSTLFINIEGEPGTNGANTFIGGLNSAGIEVDFGVAVRLRHGGASTDIFQTVDNGIQLPVDGTLFIDERATPAGNIANNGQFWVRNDTVQKPMFTDDAGRDHNLIAEFDEQTTDSTVNNTTTLAATQIQFADIPTGHYRIDMMVLARDVAVSGCGLRLQMSITGADPDSVMRVSNKNFAGAGAPSYDEIGLASDLFDGIALVTGSGTSRFLITGVIEFISGTNSFEVEFAQNTAQVGDLDFEAGSWCSLTRVGP